MGATIGVFKPFRQAEAGARDSALALPATWCRVDKFRV